MNGDAARLAAVRRIYFYSVAFLSFTLGLAAFNDLLRLLIDIWLTRLQPAWIGRAIYVTNTDFTRDAIARDAGLLVVATPLFLLHWGYANHRFVTRTERHSALRKLFLYAVLVAPTLYLFGSLYELLDALLSFVLTRSQMAENGVTTWIQAGLMVGVSTALVFYWRTISAADGDYGRESGAAGIFRRLFQLLAGLAGIGAAIGGGANLLNVLLSSPLAASLSRTGTIWAMQLADGGALLIVGLILARQIWLNWRGIIVANPAEGRTGLRRLYLFGAIAAGAIAALVPATLILRELLTMLFGTGSGSIAELLYDLTRPFSFIPFGAAVFWFFTRELRLEEARYGDGPESITVRRIYFYLVSAIGLALAWIGVVEILQSLIDGLWGASVGKSDIAEIAGRLWIDPLATGLAFVAVGAPVWLTNWRIVQQAARTDDQTSEDERSSTPRRIYTYGVALVGALLVLFYVAQILYRVFLLLMGDPNTDLWTSSTAKEVASGTVALIAWLYHMQVIRTDNRLGRAVVHVPEAARSDLPTPARERERLVVRIAQLEEELSVARQALAVLNAEQSNASDATDAPH